MTRTHWVERHLRDLITIKHGFAFQGEYFRDRGPFILLTPGNFWDEGGFKLAAKQKHYDGPMPDGFVLSEGDLIVAMTEQAEGLLGSAAIIPTGGPYLHNQRLGLVETEQLNKRFLFYLFNSSPVRQQIRMSASGAKVRHTSPTRIGEVRVRIPPLGTQRRIADILSAYDDLIEVNRRRIAILEEMARRLFEEWFVRFRYPGHEYAKIIDGLPEGWTTSRIDEAYEGLFDGPHATPAPSGEGPVFLGIKNIRETGGLDLSTIRHLSEADFPRWTRRVTPTEGDIVFSYEATLNLYALVPRGLRCCLGRRMALIRPKDGYRYFLFLHLLSKDWRRVIAGRTLRGATVDRIPLTTFPEFPLTLPPITIAAAFGEAVGPPLKMIEALREQNNKLAQARDLLLPKLISGEINVNAAPVPDDVTRDAA